MTNQVDEFAVAFDFQTAFEEAPPRQRPRVLSQWCIRYPDLRGLLTELARDIIRDERRVTS